MFLNCNAQTESDQEKENAAADARDKRNVELFRVAILAAVWVTRDVNTGTLVKVGKAVRLHAITAKVSALALPGTLNCALIASANDQIGHAAGAGL
jgi:hypothetical protein